MFSTFRPDGRLVAAAILGAAAVKAVLSLQLELTSVESYLWMCARHPAAGYYDYPGMIAWMTAVSTSMFGHSVLGVRMLSLAAGAGTAGFIFLTARRLYGGREAAIAGVLAALAPLFFVYGAQATPDAPLLLFWSAALWALAHAFSGDSPRWWYPAGLFLGLAMDSKYHAIFFPFGVAIFLLLSPDHRAWLRRKEPYLAVLLALAAFSPTLIWNAQHHWQSFLYQGVERFGERPFRAKELITFPASQLGLMTPFVAAAAWVAGLGAIARWKTAPWQERFLAAVGLPVLLFFAAVLFTRTVRGHWPAPAYVSLLVLASAAAVRRGGWTLRLFLGTAAVVAAAYVAAPVAGGLVPAAWRTGWAQLAREVKARDPQFVIAREYHLASQLGYHLRPVPAFEFTALGRGGKAFPHWWRAADFAGKDAVVVLDPARYGEERPVVARAFGRLEPPVEVEVVRFWGRREKFLIVVARGFIGSGG